VTVYCYGYCWWRNDKFCITAGPEPELLAYWPSQLNVLVVNGTDHLADVESHSGSIGSNVVGSKSCKGMSYYTIEFRLCKISCSIWPERKVVSWVLCSLSLCTWGRHQHRRATPPSATAHFRSRLCVYGTACRLASPRRRHCQPSGAVSRQNFSREKFFRPGLCSKFLFYVLLRLRPILL